jgi:hypothetical protein
MSSNIKNSVWKSAGSKKRISLLKKSAKKSATNWGSVKIWK